jgi:hypothetical protein
MSKSSETIHGKTVKQWADHFGVTVGRIYQLKASGSLESRINGTWKPGKRQGVPQFGRTYREWAAFLGVKESTVWGMNRRGDLERIVKGEPIPNRMAKHVVCGMTLPEIQDKLGMSRQRVHQLLKNGLLKDRVDGRVDAFDNWVKRNTRRRDEQLQPFYDRSKTVAEMALAASVTWAAMYVWLRSRGKKFKAGKPGRKHA